MRAVRVFVNKSDADKVVKIVQELNNHENFVVVLVNPTEFVIVTKGSFSMAWAKAIVMVEIEEYIMEKMK